ncbi:gluconokinase [Ferruginibacter sp. HRS2-29]|uniref:gluconokinase n=1 Tax=Ferruginibacter sp. HRS2-29 TaxID=2487334 RepID=UPI0020CCB8D4|nr:gluconokinase [Ferruginibacter sp. HRS2-29]MCP9753449.1 gluconokinase [Ferruginibacter sp. HRS2-29]
MRKTNHKGKDCIITIELGTNAVRIFAFDLKGALIGFSKGTYPTFHPQPDYSEQDPEQLFITMLYVLKNFLTEKIHSENYTVVTICFSASMHSVLPIDINGVPFGNAITWADNRGKNEANALKNTALGKKIYNATGTPIHPMSPLIKITWLKNNDKVNFKKTFKFLSIKSYIIQQLTGKYVIDHSIASATGLFNIHNMDWDPDALAYAGITADKLPDLVTVFHSPGKLRKEYQTSLGLSAQVKILTGSSDGCLAALGAGVWSEGKATITIEDSGAMRVVGKKVMQDEKERFFNYVLTADYFVSGGPTNNGGVIFEWLARQFGDFKNAYDIETCMEELINDATKVAAGADGLLFLPYLLGERAPIWNANARGCFFGINIKHEQKHFVRAAIEGILYEIYSIGKTIEEHRHIKTLSVNGSFATIPFCSQLIADIFNKPVGVSKNINSVSLGAFLLSATEMGIYKNLDAAAKSVVLEETFTPNKLNHALYKKYFEIFERLSSKFAEEFEAIANLQQENR